MVLLVPPCQQLRSNAVAFIWGSGRIVPHPEVVAGRNCATGVQPHGCVGGNQELPSL